MIKYLIVDTVTGGYKSVEMGATEFAQENLTPVDTSERDALVIPTGAVPMVFNSDTSTFQMKLPGGAWYSLATTSYADALVVGLWDDRGNYDASGNTYPATGGSGSAGAIKKGDVWTISVQGTLNGAVRGVGSTVRALVDAPAQTDANWAISENNFGYTPENQVNKATGFGTLNDTLYPSVKAVNDQITARRTENGILANSVGDVGTDADLLEKTLKTYTLPAATLAVNGSYIEVEAFFRTADNANVKTIKIYFGGTSIGIIDAVALQATHVYITAKIMRTAAGGQLCLCKIEYGNDGIITDATSAFASTTKTLADEQIIKVTGINGVAALNEIVAKNMIIKNNVLTA